MRKEITEEIIPCGKSVTTRWYDGDKLVRQDCEIVVEKGFLSTSDTGEK